MGRLLIAFALFASILPAQTVSGTTVLEVDRSSAVVQFTVSGWSAAPYSRIEVGTASGGPYTVQQSKSTTCYGGSNCGDLGTINGLGQLPLSGLDSNQTYYVRVGSRPNEGNDTGIVYDSEVSFATSNLSFQSPTSPTSWDPGDIDTSGYEVVTIQANAGTGACEAAASNATVGVTAGAALDVIVSAIASYGYGVTVQGAPGGECEPPDSLAGYSGLILPHMALDDNCGGTCTMTDSRHRYVAFETSGNLNNTLAPPGTQLPIDTPASAMFTLCAADANTASTFFDTSSGGLAVHHFLIRGMRFAPCSGYALSDAAVDPATSNALMRLIGTYNSENNSHIVLDRIKVDWPGAPYRVSNCINWNGNYMASIGSVYLGCEFWEVEMNGWSTATISSSTQIDVPASLFTVSEAVGQIGTAATESLTLSSVTGSGSIVCGVKAGGLNCIRTSGIATVTCAGCASNTEGALPAKSCGASSLDPDLLIRFWADVDTGAGGEFVNMNSCDYPYGPQTSHYSRCWVSDQALRADGGPYNLTENFCVGVGQPFFIDQNTNDYIDADVTFKRNRIIYPEAAAVSGSGHDRKYENRNPVEVKAVHRAEFKGNLVYNTFQQNNDGAAFLLSGRCPYAISASGKTGIEDVGMLSNKVAHGASGIAIYAGNIPANGDTLCEPIPTRRVNIDNNLFYDMGGWVNYYALSSGGLFSPVYTLFGPQDVRIANNTTTEQYKTGVPYLYIGGGIHWGNELLFEDNIAGIEVGQPGGHYNGTVLGSWAVPSGSSGHAPAPIPSFDNSTPDADTNLGQFFLSSTTVSGNTGICTKYQSNDTFAGLQEISKTNCDAYLANWTGVSTPTGDTYAARISALGLTPSTGSCTGCGSAGVNYSSMLDDQGVVRNITVTPTADGADLTYTAPDAGACYYRTSPAGAGNWTTWAPDGGGAVSRTPSVTGLSSSTSYDWQLLCHFLQRNDQSFNGSALIQDWPSDQVSVGTLMTLAGGPPSAQGAKTGGNAALGGGAGIN